MADSRLRRRSLKQSKNQLYVSLIGIVVVLFVAVTFGPTLIGGAGVLIDKITGKSGQQEAIKSNADIQPPTLSPLPVATPSASISITGNSDYPNAQVELYVNDSRVDTTDVDSSQIFNFTDVKLTKGDNTIKARLIINDKKSDFSDEEKISRVNDAPTIDISSPADHASFTKADQQITVTGKTDSQNSVTVNNFVAIVDNSGNFTYNLNLNGGDNKITVVATDPAGQSTTKEITVSYSQ